MHNLTELLLKAENSTTAVAGLFNYYKGLNAGYSLGTVCARASIPSRGYLLDVIKGRRVLNTKYGLLLARAFRLSEMQAAYFNLLVERDHLGEGDELAQNEFEMKNVRKILRVSEQSLPTAFTSPYFAVEVFCSLSLFKNRAKLKDLLKYFGYHRRPEVIDVLGHLEERGMIECIGGTYHSVTPFIVFGDSQNGSTHLEFLGAALDRAKENVPRWFKKNTESHIESTVVSVNKDALKRALPKLKTYLRRFQTELETEDADTLMKFNVQIYPDE